MASLAKLVVSLGANVAGFETDMQRASRNQKKRMREMERQVKQAGKAIGVALAATAAGMGAVVVQTTKTADSMAKLGRRLGASTESLSELGYVAERSGVDFRTLEMGLQRMTRRIGEVAFLGKGEAKIALETLGLAARKLAELPLDKQFEAIAEELSKVENTSQRTSLAMKIFDAEGVRLVQLMEDGAGGIQKLRGELQQTGAVIGGDLARYSEQFNDNLALMGRYAEGARNQFTSGMLPALVDIQDHFLKSSRSTEAFARAGEWLADVIKRLVAAFIVLKGVARAVGRILVGMAAAIYNAFRGLVLAVKRPIDQLAKAMSALKRGEIQEALDALGDVPEAIASGFQEGIDDALIALGFMRSGMEETEAAVQDAFALMNHSAEQMPSAMTPVVDSFDSTADAAQEMEGVLQEVIVTAERMPDVLNVPADAPESFNAYASAIDEGVRIIERAFNSMWDGLLSGSETAFDAVADGFRSLLANLVHQASTQQIALNIQDGFKNGFTADTYKKIGEGIAVAAGVILGANFGGGGPGASAGASIGAAIGSIWGPWGAAAGGLLGGIAGSFSDKPDFWTDHDGSLNQAIFGNTIGKLFNAGSFGIGPAIARKLLGIERPAVLETSGYDTAGLSKSDTDTLLNTVFGDVFLRSRRIDGGQLNDISNAIETFDNTIAKFLDDGSIEAISTALEDWGVHMRGAEISIEDLLSSRLDVILTTLGGTVEEFARQGKDLEDQIDRVGVALAAENILDEFSSIFPDRTLEDFLSVVEGMRHGSETITEAFERLVESMSIVVAAQQALRDFADSDLAGDFQTILDTASLSLTQAVARMNTALMDAIAGFDGSPEQLQEIGLLAQTVREGELKLLAQIDSIQKGLNSNLDKLRADILGIEAIPKTPEELFRDAQSLIDQIGTAQDASEIAALGQQFESIIRSISPEDQRLLGSDLIYLIDSFQAASNEALEALKADTLANAESMRGMVDEFLTEIGDPLQVIANSLGPDSEVPFQQAAVIADGVAGAIHDGNTATQEILGIGVQGITDEVAEIGPAIARAIRQGLNGVDINVSVTLDEDDLTNA